MASEEKHRAGALGAPARTTSVGSWARGRRPREEKTMRTNLAGRAGRWSAAHWKQAAFGWIAFAVARGRRRRRRRRQGDEVLGDRERRVAARRADSRPGQLQPSRRARACSCSRRPRPSTSRCSLRRSAGVVQTLAQQPNVTGIVSPIDHPRAGLVSRDRHSALVQFDVKGKAEDAKDKIAPILAAIDAAQAADPGSIIEEFGQASADHQRQPALRQRHASR